MIFEICVRISNGRVEMTLTTRFKSKYLKINRNSRPRTVKNILYYEVTFYEKKKKRNEQ